MSFAAQIEILTRGGVPDLSRVVGVMALLDITPRLMRVSPQGTGLCVVADLEVDQALLDLCLARLSAQFAVLDARPVGPVSGVPPRT